MGLKNVGQIGRIVDRSARSESRVGGGARSGMGTEPRPRRVHDDRRRQDLEESRCTSTITPARSTSRCSPSNGQGAVRRHVAGGPPALGAGGRRPRPRRLALDRRRRHLEAAAPRTADGHHRPHRRWRSRPASWTGSTRCIEASDRQGTAVRPPTTWATTGSKVSDNQPTTSAAFYFTHAGVAPDDADRVYFLGFQLLNPRTAARRRT